jgi:dihydroorotase
MNELRLLRPDDWHLHLRDGAELAAVVGASAAQFARAIVMPNLGSPVVTLEQALAYRERILAALPSGSDFEPLMTLYLTETTSPATVRAARASGIVHAIKLYPAGATTNSDAGVRDWRRVSATLEVMQEVDIPLLVHGEVTTAGVDVFDREQVFIDQVLVPLRAQFPQLRVVFEHITTRQAADYVRTAPGRIAATITPQHLLYNRNAIFSGGLRPHWYCLPVLKREEHRLALVAAATSGNPRYFLGTDSAPHAARAKEHACGCAGCFTAPHALELYASAFAAADALEQLEGFASCHGPDFYGLARNREQVVLQRRSWQVPASLPFGAEAIVPLAAGTTLDWQFAGTLR